jgi:SAM-dependent methyltransferase
MPDFNAWHANVAKSPSCAQVFRQALGLPREVASNSLLSWAGIAEVTAALRLAPGQLLVDLACGRGGYSMEVARRTGARLIGVDFSPPAVTIASDSVASRELTGRARFCLGDYTAAGLRAGSADAVMCIDAIQFAEPPLAGLREFRRILARGGRLAVTAWEPLEPVDEALPERLKRMNLARDLAEAGFAEITVTGKPDWHETERALWRSALQTEADGDPGMQSLHREATEVLSRFDAKRRVFATATAP